MSGPGGTSSTGWSDEFTYNYNSLPQPQVTGLSESSGNPGDGIYIYGSGFTGATGVSFGGNGASYWQVYADSEIYATVPSGSSGQQVDVTVSGPGGTSSTGWSDEFTYNYAQPQVTGLSESSGNSGDGIWIYGSGFTGASGVSFGGNGASYWQVYADSEIYATVPSGSSGQQVDVTVSGPGGTSSTGWSDEFTYNYVQPQVTGLSESSGNPGDGIYIYGSGFTGASGVSFGGNGASYWQVYADSEIYATVPSGSSGQQVDVTVTGPGGTSSTGWSDEFTYNHLQPQVTGLSESSGNSRRRHLHLRLRLHRCHRRRLRRQRGQLLAGLRRQRDLRHRAVGLVRPASRRHRERPRGHQLHRWGRPVHLQLRPAPK